MVCDAGAVGSVARSLLFLAQILDKSLARFRVPCVATFSHLSLGVGITQPFRDEFVPQSTARVAGDRAAV